MASNMTPDNQRPSTSPETLPLEDTALAQNQLANRLDASKTTSKLRTQPQCNGLQCDERWILADGKRLKNLW
ncbi:MAG: hypothetical protein ACK56W_23330 [Pirellula sp.]